MKTNEETTKIHRVALYCRVSTDKQASKEDSSLDTQRDRLVRYIEDKKRAGQNWTLAYEFVEGEEQDGTRRGRSGKDLDRPGFSQLMEKVRARLVDIVVFTKIDRISRNVVDFLTLVEEFERYDVKLVSLKEEINTASASGRVMTTIMIALAQFEREQISERTREKMAWRAGKGLPIGPPPIGYEMHEKRYRVVPREAEWVRFLDAAYLDTRSLNKVAKLAYQKGVRSRKGRTLTKDAISRVLRNPIYVGLISYNGETFKGSHEAIRDQATYGRILESLEQNNRRNGNGKSKAKQYDYLLQGLVLCGYCGGKMVPRTSLGRGGNPYHYYICSRADKTAGLDCRQNYLDAIEADRHVLAYVKQLALRDDLVRKLCEDRDASFAESLRALRQDRDRVKEQLAENRRQATNLVKMMARMGGEPPEAMLLQCREFELEKKELEETLSRMGEEISKLEQTSMRVDLAGRTIRCLSRILDHPGVTPDHLKDCLPKFINHVTWKKDVGAHQGRFEVALFERPFRSDRGRLLREVVEDLGGGPNGHGGNGQGPTGIGGIGTKGHTPPDQPRRVAQAAPGAQPGMVWGPLSDPASNKRPLAWDPEMDEVPDRPPFMLMIDSYFTIYQGRRRTIVTGKAPAGLPADRPPQERTWRACRNRMNEEPPWERAERYRRLMQDKGYRSIRALARATGEDHSRLARVLKVLDLPEAVLAALREHAGDVRIRAHFTEKRLRRMAARQSSERTILREIRRVVRGAAPLAGVNA